MIEEMYVSVIFAPTAFQWDSILEHYVSGELVEDGSARLQVPIE